MGSGSWTSPPKQPKKELLTKSTEEFESFL